MPIYSHSRLGSYKNCPLSYKYHYIDRIRKDGESVEAFLGRRYHETMEKLYAELKFKVIPLEELVAHYNDIWDKNWNEDVLIIRKDRVEQDYKTIGLKAIEDYYKRYHPFDGGRVHGIEREVIISLDSEDKYRVRCIIDLLIEKSDGHYEIHDYKTSGRLPEQSNLDQDRQLALYEIAIRNAWPDIKTVELVWHYVVFDKEMRSIRTSDQLEELRNDTIALIDTVEAANEYPPNESALCRWCDYQDICPLFAHKYKTDSLPANEYLKEDGVTLVNKYASLDAKRKEHNAEIKVLESEQDKIKEAVLAMAEKDNIERLYGSDKMLTLKDDFKLNYPKNNDDKREIFAKHLNEMGLWGSVTDLSPHALKRVAKDQGWNKKVPDELNEFVSIEPLKKITLSKRKDGDNE